MWDSGKKFSAVYITPRSRRTKRISLRKPYVLPTSQLCVFVLFQVYALLAHNISPVGYQPLLATDMDPMQDRQLLHKKDLYIFTGISSKLLNWFTQSKSECNILHQIQMVWTLNCRLQSSVTASILYICTLSVSLHLLRSNGRKF